MGYYTEIKIECKIHKDAPKELLDVLDYFLNGAYFEDQEWDSYKPKLEHPFFNCSRYTSCLVGANCVELEPRYFTKNLDTGHYKLKIHSEFKNYEGEIESFIGLITPYVVGRKKKQYIGYSHTDSGNRYYHHIER